MAVVKQVSFKDSEKVLSDFAESKASFSAYVKDLIMADMVKRTDKKGSTPQEEKETAAEPVAQEVSETFDLKSKRQKLEL